MRLVSLHPDALKKPMRKLSKVLKKFPKKPSPDLVHDLRTRSRRVEASLRALHLDASGRERRLLKTLKPIRKSAGRVRDLDVLCGLAADLHGEAEENCLLELLEQLGAERQRKSGKLHAVTRKKQNKARKLLKKSSKFLASSLDSSRDGTGQTERWPSELLSHTLALEDELRGWPRLTAGNLHPFRLKVKELRYALQLDGNADPDLISNLGEVKDTIGEWHDWMELAAIAKKTLNHGPDCKLMKLIRAIGRKKFSHAVSLSEKTRGKYLQKQILQMVGRVS